MEIDSLQGRIAPGFLFVQAIMVIIALIAPASEKHLERLVNVFELSMTGSDLMSEDA